MANIINDILDYLEIKHTNYFVNKLFNEHPHNNDMYGLKKMLKVYNVESTGIKSSDKILSDDIFPSLFHTSQNFVLGISKIENRVTYILDGQIRSMDAYNFKRLWDGNALIITATDGAKEDNYYTHLGLDWIIKFSWVALFVIPILLIIFQMTASSLCSHYFSIALNTIGCVLCFALVMKQFNGESKKGSTFCSILSKNGCKEVLSSKVSSIFYIFTLSEIGMSFFIANIVILAFANQYIAGQIIMNFPAMIFGIWSVWYQAKRLKKWCTLCLCVQIIVWILGIYYIIMLYQEQIHIYYMVNSMIITILSMLFILVNIQFIIKGYYNQNEISSIKQKLNMFLVDNDVLNAKCKKQEELLDSKIYSTIHFGNIKSPYQLTVLTNPHCPHCAKLHKEIESVLYKKQRINIGIRFLFVSFGKEFDSACKLLIAARQQLTEKNALEIYSLWFEKKQIEIEFFIRTYGLDLEDVKVIKEFEEHKKWVLANHANKTPLVLLNGYVLPDIYEIKDIDNMDEQ